MAIAQSQDEVIRMGQHTTKMSTMLRNALESDNIDENNTRRIFHREEILDIMQELRNGIHQPSPVGKYPVTNRGLGPGTVANGRRVRVGQ